MVRSGWAVAYRRYSKDYVRDGDFAREGKVGIYFYSDNAKLTMLVASSIETGIR
jgi:endonuclease YncB( thermonuclease family)